MSTSTKKTGPVVSTDGGFTGGSNTGVLAGGAGLLAGGAGLLAALGGGVAAARRRNKR